MNECLILIADDDCEWVDRVERKLRKDYQQIQTATEVTAALDKIQNGLFDIIFCDIQMRYQDKGGVAKDDGGFQIAHSALDLIPDVKVVMITAYGSSSYIRQSFKGGAFDYLEKSLEGTKYDIIAMRDIIQEILREKEQTPISPNPFIIEEGKLPKYFLSRRSAQACAPDYNTFISKLFKETFDTRTPRHFLILGAAGTGKTCLLRHYKNFIQKKGSVVSYFNITEAYETSGPREMASSLLLGIVKGFSKYEVSHFKGFLGKLEKLGVKLGPVSLTMSPQRTESDIATLIRDGLFGISEDLQGSSDIIALFIDNVQKIGNYPEMLDIMLNTLSSTRLSKVPILLGVSCLPEDWALFTNKKSSSIARRAFVKNKIPLSNFSEEETSNLIVNTLFNTGVSFSREVIKQVFLWTKGEPFNVQLFCSNLYENQIRGTVDMSGFDKAVRKTLEDIETYHFRFLNELSYKEISILRMLASAEAPMTRKEIDIKLLDIERRDLIIESQDILDELQGKNVIRRQDASGTDLALYYIENRMLQEYVRTSPTKGFQDKRE